MTSRNELSFQMFLSELIYPCITFYTVLLGYHPHSFACVPSSSTGGLGTICTLVDSASTGAADPFVSAFHLVFIK
jgi:hypothetical protein